MDCDNKVIQFLLETIKDLRNTITDLNSQREALKDENKKLKFEHLVNAFKIENLEDEIKYLKFDLEAEKKAYATLKRWYLPEENEVMN